MKQLLLIILLIVGCAPKTTTNYYIGMTEQEFIAKNPNLNKSEVTYQLGDDLFTIINQIEKTDTTKNRYELNNGGWQKATGTSPYFYTEQKNGFIEWLINGEIYRSFYFNFDPETDTLTSVTNISQPK